MSIFGDGLLVWGFVIPATQRLFFDEDTVWERDACASAGVTPFTFSPEADAVLRAVGRRIPWGFLGDGDPRSAFGFILAQCDVDTPAVVTLAGLPDQAGQALQKLCTHYGVECRPGQLLLLSRGD